MTKYYIDNVNLGEDSRFEPRYSSIEISSEGSSYIELLENATYWWMDQDGGSLADGPADDDRAQQFIKEWCESRLIPTNVENPDKAYDAWKDDWTDESF
jgi:hypothetical protein